jgi:uncharacterized membrane protein YozB (DUF420 family)
MPNLYTTPGFLGTRALLYSDITLIVIILSSTLFTIGWRLAVGKHYEIHRWVQTTAAILNAFVVITFMIKSFLTFIWPGLPAKFFEGSYEITTVHAFIGAIGLSLGIFVDLRGNGLVPKALQFTDYKLFMRTAYTIYMISTAIGIALYIIVYVYGF